MLRPSTLLRATLLLSLAAAATLGSGCEVAIWGNGDAATETRNLPAFTAIELSASLDVEVEVTGTTDGPPVRGPVRAPVATLRCDSNLLPRIETFVTDGTLHIVSDDDRTLRPRTACDLVLSVERLESIGIEGPGSLVARGTLDALQRVNVEGPADLDVDGIATTLLEVDVDGPADVTLAGAVDQLDVDLSGPLSLDGSDLRARAVVLHADGPLDADLRADEEIDARIDGPASVTIFGDPGQRDVDVDGPASVRFR